MGFKMKGFSGFKSSSCGCVGECSCASPAKHTTKKTHFHDKHGNIIKSDKESWLDYKKYLNTLDEKKVDSNKKLKWINVPPQGGESDDRMGE